MAIYLDKRISSQVASQLPSHVRQNYETYVLFAEAYYEFLEQSKAPQEIIQNIQLYADIDESISDFINYFYKNYCADFPVNPEADKKLTLKHINELYERKGSEKAVKLLFRLLYNNDVSFYYPEIQVFKASGGRFRDRLSIRVNAPFRTMKSIIGHKIIGAVSGASARVIDAQNVDLVNQTIELFLDRKTLNGSFIPHENVYCNVPGQSNELFITKTYLAFLGRDPTEVEIIANSLDLEDGTIAPKDLIQTVAQSEDCEDYLVTNLDFMKVLMVQATGNELTTDEFVQDYGQRLLTGTSRADIIKEILGTKTSVEYLQFVLRSNDTIVVTANVRPVVTNVTVIDRGYNYNVGDIVTIDTNLGNNYLTAKVVEVSYFRKPNFNQNLANGANLTFGIVKIEVDNFDTTNVTYANANLILSSLDLTRANVVARGAYANDMPNLHAQIASGNLSFSYGQRANIKAHIGAHCEYPGTWKVDQTSGVTEGLISVPENKFGGMVFRGRRDDGSQNDDIASFVTDAFFYLLDRTPTNKEYITYKTLFSGKDANGIMDAFSDVIVKIVDSKEFRFTSKYTNVTNFLTALYNTCLGRNPETSGFKYWAGQLKTNGYSHASKLDVANAIANSMEAMLYYEKNYNPTTLIKDDVYYQPFSYVLQTSENINVWREIVKKLVHPAGLVFFGRTNVSSPGLDPTKQQPGGAGLPTDIVSTAGAGSIKAIYQYLNIPIRVLKSMPTLAAVTPAYAAPQQYILSTVVGRYPGTNESNANISYIGAGPRYETIDRWKLSYSATVAGQDLMYAQILANISLSNFDADNIRNKFDISPPLYQTNTNALFSFALSSSANVIEEGRVITFTVNTGNVPAGTELYYVIEQGGQRANTDANKGDVAFLIDGLSSDSPASNAEQLLYMNPASVSGYYYVNWSNTAVC